MCMVNHDKIFGKNLIWAIKRNFRGTCSSVEILKEYMVRERLETPALPQPSSLCFTGSLIQQFRMINFLNDRQRALDSCSIWGTIFRLAHKQLVDRVHGSGHARVDLRTRFKRSVIRYLGRFRGGNLLRKSHKSQSPDRRNPFSMPPVQSYFILMWKFFLWQFWPTEERKEIVPKMAGLSIDRTFRYCKQNALGHCSSTFFVMVHP